MALCEEQELICGISSKFAPFLTLELNLSKELGKFTFAAAFHPHNLSEELGKFTFAAAFYPQN